MSSRYADKRHTAVCQFPGCLGAGTRLAMHSGRPEWFCDDHVKAVRP